MPALQGRILVKGSQSRTAWIYSSGEKDTQDGTDKCFVRWMLLKTRYLTDIMFQIRKFMFISFSVAILHVSYIFPLVLLCMCVKAGDSQRG